MVLVWGANEKSPPPKGTGGNDLVTKKQLFLLFSFFIQNKPTHKKSGIYLVNENMHHFDENKETLVNKLLNQDTLNKNV